MNETESLPNFNCINALDLTDWPKMNHLLKIKKVYEKEVEEVNKLVKGMDLQL